MRLETVREFLQPYNLKNDFSRTILALYLVWITIFSAQAQSPPSKLTFLGIHGNTDALSLTLDSITYSNKTAGSLAGTGTLTFTINGVSLPGIPNVPFSNISVDQQGRANGFSYTLGSDQTIPTLFDSGLGVTLGKGTQFLVDKNSAGDSELKLSGGQLTVLLPFHDADGNAAKLQLSSALSIAESGEMDIKANNATLETGSPGISLPGCVIQASPFNLAYHHYASSSGKKDTFSFNIPTASLSANLPGIISQDNAPLALNAANINIDQDGQVSFTNATLTGAVTIPLAQPMGFVLTVNSASLSMQNSQPTAFTMNCDVTLPSCFSAQADGTGSVTLKNISFDLQKGLFVKLTGPISLYWNNFGLQVSSNQSIILDFSSSIGDPAEKDPVSGVQLPDKWRGICITDATLTLPPTIGGGNGQTAQVSVQNVTVDEHGVSGSAELQAGQLTSFTLDGFDANLTKMDLTLLENNVANCDIEGGVNLQGFGNIGISASMTTSGNVSVSVKTDQPIQSTYLPCSFTVSKGSFQDNQGQVSLMLSGNIQFDSTAPSPLANAAVQVQDVGVDSSGHFEMASAWLNLPHPVSLDIGPASLDLRQIGFGVDGTQDSTNGQFWIGLTGDVKLGGDLPVSVQGTFNGLRIYAGNNKPVSVSIGSLAVDLQIQNIIEVQGELDFHKAGDLNGEEPQVQEDYMGGSLNVSLSCLQSSGFGCNFLVAKNAWFVDASLSLPEGIPLGNTGLALGGFAGRIGENVQPAPGGPTEGIPCVTYKLVPRSDQDIQANGLSFLFTASVRIQSAGDASAFWGDVTLTVDTQPLNIDLNGTCYLADQPDTQVPADPSKHDRVLSGDISYNAATSTFQAALTANLNLPSKAADLISVTGSMVLHISPGSFYLHVGGPATLVMSGNLPSAVNISNPIQLTILPQSLNLQLQGALDLDLNSQNGFSMVAALDANWQINSSNPSLSLGPLSAGYTLSAGATLAMYASLQIHNGFTATGVAMVNAWANIDVWGNLNLGVADPGFNVGLSVALNAAAIATVSSNPAFIDVVGDLNGNVIVHFMGDHSIGVSAGFDWKQSV